ncbi:neurexin-1, putative [Babesia caballi]|uniref:Neurexin-1, putative n=1 Tax=Babesia caballi TaxID=5871 RepID=A0AAV4M2J1_BABCB|nr:neurexin-1, putative [Babesia caballi]
MDEGATFHGEEATTAHKSVRQAKQCRHVRGDVGADIAKHTASDYYTPSTWCVNSGVASTINKRRRTHRLLLQQSLVLLHPLVGVWVAPAEADGDLGQDRELLPGAAEGGADLAATYRVEVRDVAVAALAGHVAQLVAVTRHHQLVLGHNVHLLRAGQTGHGGAYLAFAGGRLRLSVDGAAGVDPAPGVLHSHLPGLAVHHEGHAVDGGVAAVLAKLAQRVREHFHARPDAQLNPRKRKLPAEVAPAADALRGEAVQRDHVQTHVDEHVLHGEVGGHARHVFVRFGGGRADVVAVDVLGRDPAVKADARRGAGLLGPVAGASLGAGFGRVGFFRLFPDLVEREGKRF